MSDSPETNNVVATRYISVDGQRATLITEGFVVGETLSCFSINGKEIATFMCSPNMLEELGVGFLFTERLISKRDDLLSIHISQNNCIDIWIKNFEKPKRKIKTSGCSGGVTFNDLSQEFPALTTPLQATPSELADLMIQLHSGANSYQKSRGIHTAALADSKKIIQQVEDIGRHNCIDKLAGFCLLTGLNPSNKIILTSGRISSEMLTKARILEVPLVCSRTSPTSLSIALAQAWGITIVAYLRQNRMRIYTHPERILLPE